MPILLTAEGGVSLLQAVETAVELGAKTISFLTSEPLIYFLGFGIAALAIGLFARGKHAVS